MLKERALRLYEEDCSCAECILKACGEEYGIEISEDCLKSCEGFYNGLGIGGCCGALLGSIMAIGIFCDDISLDRLRLLDEFNSRLGSINCSKLRSPSGCEHIIEISCDILTELIDKDGKK